MWSLPAKRLPCTSQLQKAHLPCRIVINTCRFQRPWITSIVPRAKGGNQKNEGVYFEYEAVDPDAAKEIASLEEEDEEQFSWAQRSRDRKRAHQHKVRGFMSDDQRRKRKGIKGGPKGPAARERLQAAVDAAALAASEGPVLPSFSPVETPAMRQRALTPEELLVRPSPGKSGTKLEVSSDDPQSSDDNNPEVLDNPSTAFTASEVASASKPLSGNDRRQRLLQRMKGNTVITDGVLASSYGTSASEETQSQHAHADALDSVLVAKVSQGSTSEGIDDAVVATAAAAVSAAVGGSPSATVGADLTAQLVALADQLPRESELPGDAQQARALVASILSATGEDIREATAGDVSEMLQRDFSAQQEFANWLRRASSVERNRGDGGASTSQDAAADSDLAGTEELSEAEAADLMAAFANLELEGDLANVGVDLDLELEESAEDKSGDAAVGAAVKEVSELRQLMAQLDMDDSAADETEGTADMTDEQVLEALKTSDPTLYELLKDMPDLDKLDLDLDLDFESGADKLTEEEIAEIMAEAGASSTGAADEEDLETLLQDMRGLGLVREDGTEDVDGEDADDDDEGELALGDLLEAIDEDEDLDSSARIRAQFALQSMFNQPADELAAKGMRGGSSDEGVVAPLVPPELRGTTGMARRAIAADDEDGGVAPPPILPKPKPKPRSG